MINMMLTNRFWRFSNMKLNRVYRRIIIDSKKAYIKDMKDSAKSAFFGSMDDLENRMNILNDNCCTYC
jgi:hypothetical protein